MATVISTLNVLIGIFVTVFAVCEIGQGVSDRFEIFEEKLTQYDWYLLPIKMQRMYLIFMAHTQQTPNIQAFGNIVCSRETFKTVSNFKGKIETKLNTLVSSCFFHYTHDYGQPYIHTCLFAVQNQVDSI